jgi:hypothetical protein
MSNELKKRRLNELKKRMNEITKNEQHHSTEKGNSYIVDKERVQFYLGNLEKWIGAKDITSTDHHIETTKQLSEGYEHIINYYTFINLDSLKKMINEMPNDNYKNIYLNKLYDAFIQYNLPKNATFSVLAGDVQIDIAMPCLTKNVIGERSENSGVIIRCMGYDRHWGPYYNKKHDMPFEKKLNKIIWRGATTGNEERKGNRFKLVCEWFNRNPNIDVGFTNICQNKENYQSYAKNEMSTTNMLKYKYILSLEGNDKDSGINWKLNSNSVILMPKPTVSSWLMETTLIPDYHYVLLKDDFSDLEEKFIWCETHPEKCKEIIKNANAFMHRFSDEQYERFIEKHVINTYLNAIN